MTGRNIPFIPTSWQVITGAEDIFFPAAGNWNGTSLNNRGTNGNYWSATFNNASNAYNLNFNSGNVNPQNNNHRWNGFTVRAVQNLPLRHNGDRSEKKQTKRG